MTPRQVLWAILLALRIGRTGHTPHVDDALFLIVLALGLAIELKSSPWEKADSLALVIPGVFVLLAPFSQSPSLSIWALPAVLSLAFAFALARRMDRNAVGLALLLGGAAHAFEALHQHYVAWPDLLALADQYKLSPNIIARLTSNRPLGRALSPDLGGAISFSLAVVSSILLTRTSTLQKVLGGLACIIGIWALLLSRSAGMGVAFVVFAFVLLLLLGERKLRLGAIAIALAAPIVVLFIFGRGFSSLMLSGSERVANWNTAFEMFLAHPLTGVGFAQFGTQFEQFKSVGEPITRYAHSALFHILAEGGILGVVAFISVGAAALAALWRGSKGSTLDRIVVAATLALFSRWFYDYDAQVTQTASLAVLWLAISIPSRNSEADKFSLAPIILLVPVAFGAWTAQHINERDEMLSAFKGGGQVSPDHLAKLESWVKNYPDDQSAATAWVGVQVRLASSCQSDCQALFEQAHRSIDGFVTLHLASAVPLTWRAQLYARQGQSTEALKAAREAFAINPGLWQAFVLITQLEKQTGVHDWKNNARQHGGRLGLQRVEAFISILEQTPKAPTAP